MGSAISIDGFARELESIVELEMEKVDRATEAGVQAAASKTVEELKATSAHGDVSGAYRKGWRMKATGNDVVGYEATVFQGAQPTLTHLVEFGHGGPQPAPPHPHMEKAYEAGAEELMRRLGRDV